MVESTRDPRGVARFVDITRRYTQPRSLFTFYVPTPAGQPWTIFLPRPSDPAAGGRVLSSTQARIAAYTSPHVRVRADRAHDWTPPPSRCTCPMRRSATRLKRASVREAIRQWSRELLT